MTTPLACAMLRGSLFLDTTVNVLLVGKDTFLKPFGNSIISLLLYVLIITPNTITCTSIKLGVMYKKLLLLIL